MCYSFLEWKGYYFIFKLQIIHDAFYFYYALNIVHFGNGNQTNKLALPIFKTIYRIKLLLSI